MKNRLRNRLKASLLAGCGLFASGAANSAGVTFLIGSDVIGFHSDADFINPVVDQMANFGTKTLLYLTDSVSSINYTNGNVTIDFQPYGFVTSATDLSPYSGIYADSPGTCCSDPGPSMTGAGAAAKLSSFVSGGGSLGVGDFMGDDFWDPILGFDTLPGVTTTGGGIVCEDPGLSTPGGLAFGFAPSYSESCFVHQTYDPAFWAAKGYFALQTNGNPGSLTEGDWVTMATGFTDPGGTVPEPATILLAGLGLLGIGVSRRRRI